MTQGDFWQVTVRTPMEAEEAVAALLEDFFHQPTWVYTDEDTLITEVTAYVYKAADCSSKRLARLNARLTALRDAGLASGRMRVRSKRVRKQDWAESWKKHFKPLDIDGRLLVKPSWSRRKAIPGQIEIILDPGLSFGTGHHPTTSYCLSELVRARKPSRRQSMLDIGTGSGLLAIAAAKLGYAPVTAFDNDPESVRVATGNLLLNDTDSAVSLSQKSLEELPRRRRTGCDLVCANLLAELLIRERDRILAQLVDGGRLVVAGILHSQFEEVRTVYAGAGMRLLRSTREKEWRSGTFTRKS